mmetsp:Transcript_9728/g.42417  ORF Transcript_9728/g.42417 Transcript_9728/m.42417 type:complete len:208 (+) Transcript_9728:361-984(+)
MDRGGRRHQRHRRRPQQRRRQRHARQQCATAGPARHRQAQARGRRGSIARRSPRRVERHVRQEDGVRAGKVRQEEVAKTPGAVPSEATHAARRLRGVLPQAARGDELRAVRRAGDAVGVGERGRGGAAARGGDVRGIDRRRRRRAVGRPRASGGWAHRRDAAEPGHRAADEPGGCGAGEHRDGAGDGAHRGEGATRRGRRRGRGREG